MDDIWQSKYFCYGVSNKPSNRYPMHEIPPIIDPMGKHWKQPDRSFIDFTQDGYAIIEKQAFDALAEYSTTNPSGVYAGKMWKAERAEGWYLCWYVAINHRMFTVHRRPIILKEMSDLLGLT